MQIAQGFLQHDDIGGRRCFGPILRLLIDFQGTLKNRPALVVRDNSDPLSPGFRVAAARPVFPNQPDSAIEQRVDYAMRGVWVVIGFLFAIGAQAAYFWSTDRLAPFIEWSFVFPLLHYPPHTEWLSKLYTKLLWVWIIVGLILSQSVCI